MRVSTEQLWDELERQHQHLTAVLHTCTAPHGHAPKSSGKPSLKPGASFKSKAGISFWKGVFIGVMDICPHTFGHTVCFTL